MRFTVFLIFLFTFILTAQYSTGQTQAKRVASHLRTVTVYRQGAEVSRSAQVEVSPGTNEIIIEGLSNYIDDKTISLSGNEDINILSVTYRVDEKKLRERGGTWHTLADSLDSLELRLAYFTNQHYALEQEMQLLQENRKIAVPEKGIYIDDLEEAADFYRSRVQEIKDKLTALEEKEKNYSSMVAEVKEKLKEAGDLHNMPAGELYVRLSATEYGNKTLEMTYQTGKAGWKPVYNMRTQSDGDQVQLDYDGLVSQETGEDWQNITLTLSTGLLRPKMLDPKLGTWYIAVEDPNQKYKRYAEADEKDSSLKKSETDTPHEDWSNRMSVTLPLKLKYSIPSTGKSQYVRIQQYTLNAHFYYLLIPTLSEQSFQVGQLTGWSDFNLQPGQVSLFKDKTYLGKALFDPGMDSDTMTLIMGRDKQVHISRAKVKDISKKQFIGNTVREDFAYALNIKNEKDEAVSIVLEERIPVAKSKELEVKLENGASASYDAATGKLSWRINLGAGQSQIIQYDFSVKYPKGTAIQNLY